MNSPKQTPSVLAFLREIEAVCQKHKLVLTVSMYDALQVWPLATPGEEIDQSWLDHIRLAEDKTWAGSLTDVA